MEKTTKQKTGGGVLLRLFASMFVISAFTFGGGYVIVSLMKKKFVDEYGWLSEQEMLDYTALSQSCPGAIAINAAILTGWRVAGFAGMLFAVLGTVLPPLITLSVISMFYSAFASNAYVAMVLDGMQAGVAAVIVDVVLSMGKSVLVQRSTIKNVIMALAFIAVYALDASIILVILCAALVGIGMHLTGRKEAGK